MEKPVTHPEKRPKGVNVRSVIAMAKGGMKQHEIATETGCSRQNINAILLRYGIDKEQADEYEKYQADIIKGKLGKVILSIDDDRLKTASANNLAYVAKNLHEIYRLETNQSTANVASKVQVKDMPPEERARLDRALDAIYSRTALNAKDDLSLTASPLVGTAGGNNIRRSNSEEGTK